MDCGRDLWRLPAQPLEPRARLGDVGLQLGVRVHPNRGHEAVACERLRPIPQSLVDAGSLQRPNRVIQRRGRWPDLPVQHARCLALTAAGLEQLGPSETLIIFTARAERVRERNEPVERLAGVAAGKGEVTSCSGRRVSPVQPRVVILPQFSLPPPRCWSLDFVSPSEKREQGECVLPRSPPRQSQRLTPARQRMAATASAPTAAVTAPTAKTRRPK